MTLFAFLFGLVVGSFLNVVIVRVPAGKGLGGRSQCPHCQKRLKWHELLPLVSFVLQAGRCRVCKGSISWRYPIIELLTALLFALSFYYFGISFFTLWLLILFSLSIVVVGFDVLYKEVSNIWVYFFGAWVVFGTALFLRDTIELRVLAALGFTGFFVLLYLLSQGKWIGGADVKMAPFLGLWMSWPHVAALFMLAFVSGAIVSLLLLVTGRVGRKDELPFLPFLLGAAFISFFWGEHIVRWYLSLFY